MTPSLSIIYLPKHCSINLRIASAVLIPGKFWVRLGLSGRGVCVTDIQRHRVSFSVRYGYVKTLRIGNLAIEYLPPIGPPISWPPRR